MELAFLKVHRGWIVAPIGYGLGLGLVLLLLLDDYLSLLIRGNLAIVAGIVLMVGVLAFCLSRFPRLRPGLLVLIGMGWALSSFVFYYREGFSEPLAWRRIGYIWNDLSIIFSRIPAGVVIPIFALLIACSLGLVVDSLLSFFQRRFKFPQWNSQLERFVIVVSLGLAGLSLIIFFLGVVGLLYGEVLWGLTILIAVLALLRIAIIRPWKAWRLIKFDWQAMPKVKLLFWIIALVLFALYSWIDLVSILTPDFGYDAAWYHLYEARRYFENHRLVNMVSEYAIWPGGYMANQEMLYTYAYGLINGSGLAQAFHWLDGIMLVPAIYLFARRFFPTTVAITAALFFYSTPLVRDLVSTANNDLTIPLYFLLSLYTLSCFFEAKTKHIGWWFLALTGFLAGYMSGIKHFGMVLAALLLGSIIILLWHSKLPGFFSKTRGLDWSWRECLGIISSYCTITLLVFAPWLFRGYLDLGNPVYPALSPSFFSEKWWDSYSSESLTRYQNSYGIGQHISNFLALAWTIPTNIKAFGHGSSGPVFLIFMPISLLIAIFDQKNRFLIWGLSLITLLYTGFWFVESQQLRYLLPVYPFLAILGAYGIWNIASMAVKVKYAGKLLSVFPALFFLLLVVLNLPFFANLRRDYLPEVNYDYIFGKVSYQQVLGSQLGSPVLWLNQKLPASARIASMEGDIEEFYTIPTILMVGGGFPNQEYRINERLSDLSVIDTLQHLRITHLFVMIGQREALENGPLASHVKYLDSLYNKYFLYTFDAP